MGSAGQVLYYEPARFGSIIPRSGVSHYITQQQEMNAAQSPDKDPNKKPNKGGFLKALRDYLEAHKNILFTIVLALLADHYVFDGVFREKIKSAVDKLLDKAHKQIGE